MKTVKLPSGAELKIDLAPFAVSKALYQAVCDEMKHLKLEDKAEVDVNFFKDVFCTAVSSEKIEKAMWECLKRATYNGHRITEETFEPVEARQDYMMVLYEVGSENVLPFMKSLYAQFAPQLASLQKSLA